ncbi:MAG TPA: LPP20 family lipoprotein [Marinobacterium sp.]|nr:LPP20 family lipoprotein [Marinobacterium sp.]
MKGSLFTLLLLLSLSGCQAIPNALMPSAALTKDAAKEDWVQATGYAPISLQPGATPEQKQLNAMRVSKLRAYQELAAIVNGQYLYGTTTVESMILQNDEFKTAVAGVVRGARVVKSFPVQEDVYATILEVDLNQVERAWVSAN